MPKAAPRSTLISDESWALREQAGNCRPPAGLESQTSRECPLRWILLDRKLARRCIRDLVTLSPAPALLAVSLPGGQIELTASGRPSHRQALTHPAAGRNRTCT